LHRIENGEALKFTSLDNTYPKIIPEYEEICKIDPNFSNAEQELQLV
jgi:hypothetical protein